MGASDWNYIVRFSDVPPPDSGDSTAPSPSAALIHLQNKVVADGDILWEDDEVDQPDTLAELHDLLRSEASEWLMESGTHSIVDVHQLVPAGSPDEFGTLVGATPSEATAFFGSERPTPEQFTAVFRAGSGELTPFPRWSGRWVTLFAGDEAVAYGFWGFSGD